MEEGLKTEGNRLKDERGKFVPGNPGGPGRPKGSYSIVELIRKKLQETPEGKDKTYGEEFVEKVMKKISVDEDVTMMKDLIDRIDGKPRQNIGLDGGAEDKAITFAWKSSLTTNQEDGQKDSTMQPQDGSS